MDRRSVAINVSLIEEIEEACVMDCEPPPSVVAPLMARTEAHRAAWRNPDADDELQDDIRKALNPYGGYLYLEEIHAIHRLRGWHRARYGRVAVDRYWLAEVRDVLRALTMSHSSECEETVREFGLDRVRPIATAELARREYRTSCEIRAEVLASMTADETCGECKWCWMVRLCDQCGAILREATKV